ncbi:hypothetical protein [Spongiimicrobium salis]|uniref:hypothetical protein n=1 Tax=Spongiimicrobium salis TaxID=1667022 RepID=UPI00374D20CF
MAGKMTLKDKRAMAEELFMNTEKSQKEIAQIVHVTEKTIGKWKDAGNWEILRQARTVTANNIITNLYQRAYELSLEGQVDADKLSKIASSIEKLSDRRVTISSIINVFKDFTGWAYGEDPEMAKAINDLQRKYVDHKLNEG